MNTVQQDTVKDRDFLFDNLKVIGICLVVFGHLIEKINSPVTNIVYKIIYLFHMPLFVFISGYFSRFSLKKIITKLVLPYLILQIVYIIFEVVTANPSVDVIYLLTPKWVLWYLFALIVWKFVMYFVEKTKKLLPVYIITSIAFSLVFGFLQFDGYLFSISRIVVFFPFFLIGYWFNQTSVLSSQILKPKFVKIFIVLSAILCVGLYFVLFNKLSSNVLYGALNYHQGVGNGIWLRTYVYLTAFLVTFALVLIVPKSKNIFSFVGQQSFLIYVIHAPIARAISLWLNSLNVVCPITLSILFAVVIISLILLIKFLYVKIVKSIKEKQIETN